MLCPGLSNQEIPHRTKLRHCIMEIWNVHVHDLKKKMQVSFHTNYKIFYLLIYNIGSTWKNLIYG